jgi:hypothetical protein
MSQTPLHDWLGPRLQALLREAEAAGFQRDIAMAVLQDMVTSSPAAAMLMPEVDD